MTNFHTRLVGEPQASGVLERANVVVAYNVVSIMQKDSLDMTDANLQAIKTALSEDEADIIIITHGTDTMIKTAEILQHIPNKTMVITGSMYPAQYRDSDAVFNLDYALVSWQILEPGVYIATNGRIFNPTISFKNVEQNRFEDIELQ